ncbi:MAG: acetyltransferase [Burkholderiales bacterium]
MTHFDVFNGDADGITSLVQLRLAEPLPATLVTGTKRDISLLRRVPAQAGDTATVLDISLAVNRPALCALLERGVAVRYFDHHVPGEVPVHPALDAHIDTAPSVCTGVLVDRYLGGRQRVWAVVAAFGDNLIATARELAAPLALHEDRLAALRALGDSITYNAYSDDPADAIVPPADLYVALRQAADPLRFVDDDPAFAAIDEARRRDMEEARATRAAITLPNARVYILPDEPWTRRVRGVFGNEIANAAPDLAHAVLTGNPAGGYTVSVRAPRARPIGADALCRPFGGGGRAAAAGIEHLPKERFHEFVRQLEDTLR